MVSRVPSSAILDHRVLETPRSPPTSGKARQAAEQGPLPNSAKRRAQDGPIDRAEGPGGAITSVRIARGTGGLLKENTGPSVGAKTTPKVGHMNIILISAERSKSGVMPNVVPTPKPL